MVGQFREIRIKPVIVNYPLSEQFLKKNLEFKSNQTLISHYFNKLTDLNALVAQV